MLDALDLLKVKRYRDGAERLRWLNYACVALPVAFTTVFILVGAPVSLVFIGAVGQGLMLPFLAGAAIYYHFTNPHRDLRAGKASLACLIVASVLTDALLGRLDEPCGAQVTPDLSLGVLPDCKASGGICVKGRGSRHGGWKVWPVDHLARPLGVEQASARPETAMKG